MIGANSLIKIIFGLTIFLFGLAFAYFTAHYVDQNKIFDYWVTLVLFGFGYVLVGLVINRIYPISLGFLLATDILILHALSDNYSTLSDVFKTSLVGAVLATLYFFAWHYTQDEQISSTPQNQAQPTPSV